MDNFIAVRFVSGTSEKLLRIPKIFETTPNKTQSNEKYISRILMITGDAYIMVQIFEYFFIQSHLDWTISDVFIRKPYSSALYFYAFQ